MATEASSLVRILSGYKEKEGEGKGERESNIVSRDFAVNRGGGAVGLDIEFQLPPPGSEKRLDSPVILLCLNRVFINLFWRYFIYSVGFSRFFI